MVWAAHVTAVSSLQALTTTTVTTMKAHRSFTVRTQMPAALAPLQRLASNLRWSWDDRSRRLFRWVDAERWEQVGRDPVRLLAAVPRTRFDELAADTAFMSFLDEIHDDLTRYLTSDSWLQLRGATPLRAVAYFSPEFGISEALPQYSGGLGVLAGDHLKAASALGIPLTGVGLFYRQGYFSQSLDMNGLQREDYPILEPHLMAIREATDAAGTPVRITLDLAGSPLVARVWSAQVGRINLYLLDADIDDNDSDTRAVTDRLYGGGEEQRIRQEILLGIGGVRVLQSMGVATQVFHSNEGHAGFLGLERIRQLITNHGLTWPEAIEAVRAGTVFTTHTPVPAGIDRFPRDLMAKYFTGFAQECGVPLDELLTLGREPDATNNDVFNMAIMGLRLAGQANGVSKLHGAVSREMFADLWPDVPADEVPIGSVTNGVHGRTWVSLQMAELLERYVLPSWPEAGEDRWQRIEDCPDDVLWRVREENRSRLVSYARERLRRSAAARGAVSGDLAWTERALDPSILTIGFARRFATYKRATLLLSDPERLKRLLLHPDRPMQLLFAGKAHPADNLGKDLIRQVATFSLDPAVRHRIAFIDGYDIGVARQLYQGCDVWLNNPRRPMEACGTSGEKATLNGALNLSVLDGWWDEMYLPATSGDVANGWAIPSAENIENLDERDRIEANWLFELLEREVVPTFYERDDHTGLPHRWIRRIKRSLATLGHGVQANRMVQDYVTDYYEPAAARGDALTVEAARALHGWKQNVRTNWPNLKIMHVDADDSPLTDLGGLRRVTARIDRGSLVASDIDVQLVHGSVGLNDEIVSAQMVSMAPVLGDDGAYRAEFPCDAAGRYGFTVRVVPRHPNIASWADVGVLTALS